MKVSKAHLSLIGANILFGLNYSFSKSLIPGALPPETLSILRVLFAAAMFAVVVTVLKRWRIDRADIWKLAVAGLLGVFCNQLIFLKGLNRTSPIDASIIATLIPILVLLLSAVVYKERITKMKLTGILIGVVGALIVIIAGGMSGAFDVSHLFGNLLVLFSAVSYSCYLVWAKKLLAKYDSLTVMVWIFSFAAIMMSAFLWQDIATVPSLVSAMSGKMLFALGFVLIGATFLGYLLIATGLKKVKPTTVSIYSYAQPVVASLFAVISGQDTLTWLKIFSAVLVFVGVYIVTISYRYEK